MDLVQQADLPTVPALAPLSGAASALVSKRVTACTFIWQPGTPQRTGLLTVELSLAEDGEQGLEVLNGMDPDVIITDINMPRLDGFGFIDAVRARDDTKTPDPRSDNRKLGRAEIARP